MEQEKTKALSKKLARYLSKKNLNVNDLRDLGEEIGKIFAHNIEVGDEEDELDSFLFGFVNSFYTNIKRPEKIADTDSSEQEKG